MASTNFLDSSFAKSCVKRVKPSSVSWSNKSAPKRYNPPPKSYATVVRIPIIVPHELMKYVIGSEGGVFKAITHKCEHVDYIWYDARKRVVELWAPCEGSFQDAIDLVNDRMLTIFIDKLSDQFDDLGPWGDVDELS